MAVARRMRAMLKRFAERRKREERLRAERRRMAVERRMRAMFKRRAEMRRVGKVACGEEEDGCGEEDACHVQEACRDEEGCRDCVRRGGGWLWRGGCVPCSRGVQR